MVYEIWINGKAAARFLNPDIRDICLEYLKIRFATLNYYFEARDSKEKTSNGEVCDENSN